MCELNHVNVIKMMGVCVEARPYLTVLEIMNYGDIRKVLKV